MKTVKSNIKKNCNLFYLILIEFVQIEDSNDSPFYFLNMSLFNLATSLKHKNRNYETHFRLAMLLEEKELFESIYGKEKEVKNLFFYKFG